MFNDEDIEDLWLDPHKKKHNYKRPGRVIIMSEPKPLEDYHGEVPPFVLWKHKLLAAYRAHRRAEAELGGEQDGK